MSEMRREGIISFVVCAAVSASRRNIPFTSQLLVVSDMAMNQQLSAFRDLHQRYPVENLQGPLTEGIRTGHPTMPEFRLDPGQISDLIALLNTLK